MKITIVGRKFHLTDDLKDKVEKKAKHKADKKDKGSEDVKDMIARDNQLRLALQFVKTLPVLRELQK